MSNSIVTVLSDLSQPTPIVDFFQSNEAAITKSAHSLKVNTSYEDISVSLICSCCNLKFALQQKLIDHVQQQHSQVMELVSKQCDTNTSIISNSQSTNAKCSFCDFVCFPDALSDHLITVHRVTDEVTLNLQMTACSNFIQNNGLEMKQKVINCFICTFSSSEKSNVINHCLTNHLEQLIMDVSDSIIEITQPENNKPPPPVILLSDSDDDNSICVIVKSDPENITWQSAYICYICHYYSHEELKIKDHLKTHQNFSLYQTVWFQYINSENDVSQEELHPKGNMNVGFLCEDCSFYFNENIKIKHHQLKVHSESHTFKIIKFEIDTTRKKESESGKPDQENKILEIKVEKSDADMAKPKKYFLATCVYVCSDCKIKFSSYIQLRDHILNQSHQLWCFDCNFHADNLHSLFSHSVSEHKKPLPKKLMRSLEKCSFCPFIASDMNNLKSHNKKEHPDKKKLHSCEQCSKSFLSRLSLRIHILIYHNNCKNINSNSCENFKTKNCFRCNFCKYKAFLRINIMKHVKSVHCNLSKSQNTCKAVEIKVITCDTCNQDFTSINELQIHRIAKGHYHCCNLCNFKSFYYRLFYIHNYEKHNTPLPGNLKIKIFKCPKCPFETYFSLNFRSHIEKHNNEEVFCFVCPKCYSRTNTESKLNKHTSQCNKVKNEQNEMLEKKEIKNNLLLKNVCKKHVCKICNKNFKHTASLVKHQFDSSHYLICEKCNYSTHVERLFHLHNLRCQEQILPKLFYRRVSMFLFNWKFKFHSFTLNAIRIMGKKNALKCLSCNQKFISFSQLHKHCNTCDHKFICTDCQYSTSILLFWYVHNKIAHNNNKFSPFLKNFLWACNQCSFISTKQQLLEKHFTKCKRKRFKKDVKIGPFVCPTCQRAFLTQKRLKFHLDNINHELHCNFCGYMAKTFEHLSKHKKVHESIKRSNIVVNHKIDDSSSCSLKLICETVDNISEKSFQENDSIISTEKSFKSGSDIIELSNIDIPCPYCNFVVHSVNDLKLHLNRCKLYLEENRRGRPRQSKKCVRKRKYQRYNRRYSIPENSESQSNDGSKSETERNPHSYMLRERKARVSIIDKSEDEISSTDEYLPSDPDPEDDDYEDEDYYVHKKRI